MDWLYDQNKAYQTFNVPNITKFGRFTAVLVNRDKDTQHIFYANFPVVFTDLTLYLNKGDVLALTDQQAIEGLEEIVVLTVSLVNGMADVVYSVRDGAPNDPVKHDLVHLTCADPTLNYGVLSTQNSLYCTQTCAKDPSCLWSSFDTKTSVCVGGEYTCTNNTLVQSNNLNRLSLKIGVNPVVYNGVTITEEAFISAPAHLFRPKPPEDTSSASCVQLMNKQECRAMIGPAGPSQKTFVDIDEKQYNSADAALFPTGCFLEGGIYHFQTPRVDVQTHEPCDGVFKPANAPMECVCLQSARHQPNQKCSTITEKERCKNIGESGGYEWHDLDEAVGSSGWTSVMASSYPTGCFMVNDDSFYFQSPRNDVAQHEPCDGAYGAQYDFKCLCEPEVRIGMSCMVAMPDRYDECQWTKVANMADRNYQHPSTGSTGIYEVISWGDLSMENATEPVYVCPELAKAWASIWVGEEDKTLRVSSCASYLSNDPQQNFAVVLFDPLSDRCAIGECQCYLLPTCGSSTSPMMTYEEAFGTALSSRLEVSVLAKETYMQPRFLDKASGPYTIRQSAMDAGSAKYENALIRGSGSDTVTVSDVLFNGHDCLANHHPYYDPAMYATSSVCLPLNCSIWGTAQGYRPNMHFMEDTCKTHSACCADSYDANDLPACSQMKAIADGQYQPCAIKVVGTSNVTLQLSEFEMLPTVSSHLLTDSKLHQLKRNQAEVLKYGRDAMKSLCTVKIDLYDMLFTGNDQAKIALDEYKGTRYATHVSETCNTGIKTDPRHNELVVTNGEQFARANQSTQGPENKMVVLQSSIAPYDNYKCSIHAFPTYFDLTTLVESTSSRGNGLWDMHRPSSLVWKNTPAEVNGRKLAGITDQSILDMYNLPYTHHVMDGSTYNDLVTQSRRGPTSYLPLSTIFVSPIFETAKPNMSVVIEKRTIHGNGDMGICFSLCNKVLPFKLIEFGEDYILNSEHGYPRVYLSLEDITAGLQPHASETFWKDYVVDNVTYKVPVNDQQTVASFDEMHKVDPEMDTVILEVKQIGQSEDYSRLTYRSLDKGTIARHGGVCVDRLPLKPNTDYELNVQHVDTVATVPSMCSTKSDNLTIDYLYLSRGIPSSTVLTSTFPSIKYLPQGMVKETWTKRYHDASNFIVRNPDISQDDVLFREINDIVRNAFTETDIETLLYQLCDDVDHADDSVAKGLPIAACHGFTYRKRMNPDKLIREKNDTHDATYGDFCWQGMSSLYTDKNDCEHAYGRPCEDSQVTEKFAQFDGKGFIQQFVTGITLYKATVGPPYVEDNKNNEDRIGGNVRSACNTLKDKPFEFFDVRLYTAYPPSDTMRDVIENAKIEMRNSGKEMSFMDVADLTQSWINSTGYSVTPRVLKINDSIDRKTFLLQNMLTVVGSALSEKMLETRAYVHTDLMTANAFRCGAPTVESLFDNENGVYADVFGMTFRWNSVLQVNKEAVLDETIQFAWGRTTQDAAVALEETSKWGDFDFIATCSSSDLPTSPNTYRDYYRQQQTCSSSKSMKWKINPNNKQYENPIIADSNNNVCAAKSTDIQFIGTLTDFLDLTNQYPPKHILREDLAGSYTHKSQLALRQTLHMQSGNTLERTFFYPLYIKTYSTNVMSFSAQSPILPSAVSRLSELSVQYNYATYRSVLEITTRTCVSQPKNTTDQNLYKVVNPIASYDRTHKNPSSYKELQDLGKAKYSFLSDGFTPTAGASAEVRLLDADESDFNGVAFQGINDNRFYGDKAQVESCQLVVQDQADKDRRILGTNSEFASMDEDGLNGNKHFEFNCFRRVYVCEFENSQKWKQMHVHVSSDYIVKSNNLYVVDPSKPERVAYVSTISTTVDNKVDTQTFQVSMSVDVPRDLNDKPKMPSWTDYHAPGSQGLASLQTIASGGGGETANRIEREQRFRVSTYFTDATIRRSYGLYPVSFFAILTLKDAQQNTMQSSKPMSSTGTSILEPKKNLCGITSDMATNLSSFDTFGKLIPIYEGIFRNGASASDNSFENPSMLDLKEFLHYRAIDPELSSLLRTRQIYVSDALRDAILPEHQKGGMIMDSSILSWLMVNNIDLDFTGLDHTFDLTFCFVGAVTSKGNMRPDNFMRTVQSRLDNYAGFTKQECKAYKDSLTNRWPSLTLTFEETTDTQLPSGCLTELYTKKKVVYNNDINTNLPILTMYLTCKSPYSSSPDENYEFAKPGYTCAQSVVRFQIEKDMCGSLANANHAGNMLEVETMKDPPACFFDTARNRYVYNFALDSTTACSNAKLCKCTNYGLDLIVDSTDLYCYETVVDAASGSNSAGSKRLLGYTSGVLKINSKSDNSQSDYDYAQNSEIEHTVSLMNAFKSLNADVSPITTSLADDQSQAQSTSSMATSYGDDSSSGTHSSDSDAHDNHDSKRMRALLAVAIAVVSVFVILLLAGFITVLVDISSNLSRTRTRGSTTYASVDKSQRAENSAIQQGRGGRPRSGAKAKSYLKL
ncbi:hypothetical protein CYMTET_41425 [Cymbomonas tetramitiformis]|uniref:Uncharacterized protein n=1 Tax=Cymbomonas tetramitiformis TaxID=36881 RepID=A0AAE0C8C0_9CHLO|nr:hypothetical protein CYMTET_41425 [Cymbomonas tetramitiformis]